MTAKLYNPSSTAGAPLKPDSLLPDGYTRWSALKHLVPLSRESIRQRELGGRFPRRIHLSQRCAVWKNSELLKWLADPVGYRA